MSEFIAWLDNDGYHIWASHECVTGWQTTMLPWPQWKSQFRTGPTNTRTVMPSIHCGSCGAHNTPTILDTPPIHA